MLFQLIFAAFPAFAHHLDSVGKASNLLNSPETHVNLGQAQLDFDNVLQSTGHLHGYRHHTLIPSELVTEQFPFTQRANYGNILANIPRSKIRPFSNFGNVQLNELPLINPQYLPYYYNTVPYYTGFNPSIGAYSQARNIASPQLNFEVGKLANVGQKGSFKY